MSRWKSSVPLFLLLVAAVAAGGWHLYRGWGVPAGPPRATPETCRALLRAAAGPPGPAPGGGPRLLFDGPRLDALEALVALEGAGADGAVLQALAGDGDAADWGAVRMRAAAIRIRGGHADGAAALRAFLAGAEPYEDAGGAAEAAAAAAALGGEAGAAAIRRLLGAVLAEGDDEVVAGVLRAAATLGAGATEEGLRAILAPGLEGERGAEVIGAAAGALLRLGKDPGRPLLDGVEFPDSEEFCAGLGAPGNEAALPWLEVLLRSDEAFTRAAAARAIGAVGGAKAAAILGGALGDEDGDVRAEATVGILLAGGAADAAPAREAAAGADLERSALAWRALFRARDAASRDAAAALAAEPDPAPRDPRGGLLGRRRVWAAALGAAPGF